MYSGFLTGHVVGHGRGGHRLLFFTHRVGYILLHEHLQVKLVTGVSTLEVPEQVLVGDPVHPVGVPDILCNFGVVVCVSVVPEIERGIVRVQSPSNSERSGDGGLVSGPEGGIITKVWFEVGSLVIIRRWRHVHIGPRRVHIGARVVGPRYVHVGARVVGLRNVHVGARVVRRYVHVGARVVRRHVHVGIRNVFRRRRNFEPDRFGYPRFL